MEQDKLVALVQGAQRGENQACEALFRAYHQEIYYFIRKTLNRPNDPELAEDLTQDTFVEIFRTVTNLQDPTAFGAWSHQIAYHRCTAYFRKRHDLLADEREDGSTVFDEIPEEREEFIPGEALDREDLRNAVREIIGALPEEQRSAILMRYFEERPVEQIAQIQQTSEGTVKSRLNYGRKAIKKAVEEYERKNGIKLRCAGIVPLLLWVFRMERKSTAAAASAPQNSTPLAKKAVSAAKTVGKTAAKLTVGKIAAIAAAVVVAVSAVIAGVVLENRENHPASDVAGSDAVTEISVSRDVLADDYCGTWFCGSDTLNIYFSEAAERYYFSYRHEDGTGYDFFGEYNSKQRTFESPEGNPCGFDNGDGVLNWEDTDTNWRFSLSGDELYWAMEDETLVFTREAKAEEYATDFRLEDYPLYVETVNAYRDAVFSSSETFSEDQYPTLNTHMLFYYHTFGEDAVFCYTLMDIDGNGTPELLIGKTLESNTEIIDVYSMALGNRVQYYERPIFGERSRLTILENSLILESGSTTANMGGSTVYAFSSDGASLFVLAQYTYYFPEEGMTEPEGPWLTYEEYTEALSKYRPYSGEIPWTEIQP